MAWKEAGLYRLTLIGTVGTGTRDPGVCRVWAVWFQLLSKPQLQHSRKSAQLTEVRAHRTTELTLVLPAPF